MKLCFGTFVKVLLVCGVDNIEKKNLVDNIIRSVKPSCDLPQATVTDLLQCRSNLPGGKSAAIGNIISAAGSANPQKITDYFFSTEFVTRFLHAKKREFAVLAILDIIAKDDSIGDYDIVEKVNGIRKNALRKQSEDIYSVFLSEFLAGIFLFVAQPHVDNRAGKETLEKINWDYMMSFEKNLDKIDFRVSRRGGSDINTESDKAKTGSGNAVEVVEAEIDDSYKILTPNSVKIKTDADTYNDSYVMISVRLRNTGEETIYLNCLRFEVENYVVDKTPSFEFSLDVTDDKLIISVLNKGWGTACNAKFTVALACDGNRRTLQADKTLLSNSVSSILSNESKAVLALSAVDFSDEYGAAAENISDISVRIQYEFIYDGKKTEKTANVVLPPTSEYNQKLLIENSLFKIERTQRSSMGLITTPDKVYASVINGIESKEYRISRTLSAYELDAFNLYVGSDKSSVITFKLILLHGNEKIAESDSIVARINSYTNSESYNNRIDGCEISVDKFKKTNEFDLN